MPAMPDPNHCLNYRVTIFMILDFWINEAEKMHNILEAMSSDICRTKTQKYLVYCNVKQEKNNNSC